LGYDYCLKEECQRRHMKRVRLAAIGVNKAADYYTKAEELLPPPGPSSTGSPPEPDDAEPDDPEPVATRLREPVKTRAVKSTLEKLREREAELEVALDASYQRFCRAEITATEMDRERSELIRTFNQVVKGENIRYRSMLRKGPTR
jgi:hypothetical protein